MNFTLSSSDKSNRPVAFLWLRLGFLCLLLVSAVSCESEKTGGAPVDVADSGFPPGPIPGPVDRPFVPGPALMPRLTQTQYKNSIEAVFGASLAKPDLEADQNPYLFFSIGAASTTLSEVGTQQYLDAAIQVAEAVLSDSARVNTLLGCTLVRISDECVDDFISAIGQKLFRRPLSTFEFESWQNLARSAAAIDGVFAGLRDVIAGMLQSPYFLYRIELGELDPDDVSRLRYTGHEMASRMSFLLLNAPPDAPLLHAAEIGLLHSNAGLREEAERLLTDSRARAAVQSFFAQYLDLARLETVQRDPQVYPGFTATMPQSMRKEQELIVDDFVFRQNSDIRGLFSTRRSFVNAELANLYEIEVPGASAVAYVPVEFPDKAHRQGILTFGAFLTMNAHQSETSPTLRGKYLRERILCQTVPMPPDNVDLNLDEPQGSMPRTLRERLDEHRKNPACAACHDFIDPPGFLFENYDSVGRYRTHEGIYEVDASGGLDGVALENAEDLAPLLSQDVRVAQCLVRQLYRHAQGRLELPSERRPLLDLISAFERADFRFKDLLIELVLSDGFRYLAPEVSE
jgi:hypothetical protein